MKKLELFFQKTNFEKSFNDNTIKCAEFNDLADLKENFLNYFKDDYPIEDWEIKNFDLEINNIKNDGDGLILAINKLAFFMSTVKGDKQDKNFLNDNIKNEEIPPMLLCVRYI
jgi:hypothetical protein